jgi:hypothetical protein
LFASLAAGQLLGGEQLADDNLPPKELKLLRPEFQLRLDLKKTRAVFLKEG